MTRYKIAPDRMADSGYRTSMPIGTNKTMEGRARNRGLEVQRRASELTARKCPESFVATNR